MTREISDVIIALGGALILFILLPAMLLNHFRRARLDAGERDPELDQLGNQLDERVATVERIIAADDPDWNIASSTRTSHDQSRRIEARPSTAD